MLFAFVFLTYASILLLFFVIAERVYQGLPVFGSLQLLSVHSSAVGTQGERRKKEVKGGRIFGWIINYLRILNQAARAEYLQL